MVPSIETLTPAEDHPKAAPGDLNHIRRFVNTLDLEDKSDLIATAAGLRDWLVERDLIDERAELSLHVQPDGSAVLSPCRTGVDAAIGRLLAIVHTAMANGTWPRLKACAFHDTCEWAFYDWSKNSSGTWCDMAVCGNRAKARAYRERKKIG